MAASWNPALRPDSQEPALPENVKSESALDHDTSQKLAHPLSSNTTASMDLNEESDALLVNGQVHDSTKEQIHPLNGPKTTQKPYPPILQSGLHSGNDLPQDVEHTYLEDLRNELSDSGSVPVEQTSVVKEHGEKIDEFEAAFATTTDPAHTWGVENDEDFPDFSNSQISPEAVPAPLPRSQAEAILENEEESIQSPPLSFVAELQGERVETDRPFQDEIMGTEVPPQDTQILSAEGTMPLVASLEVAALGGTAGGSSPFSFDVDEDSGHEGGSPFFNGVQASNSNVEATPLSTPEASKKNVVENVPDQSFEKSSFWDLDAVDQEVWEAQADTLASNEPPARAADGNSQSSDLADLWKAALGDDDLSDEGESSWAQIPSDDSTPSLKGDVPPQTSSDQRPLHSGQRLENRYMPTDRLFHDRQAPSHGMTSKLESTAQSFQTTSTSSGYRASQPNSQTFADILGPSRPKLRESGSSFVDKSREGYKSPYDLPMDITRPRKHASPSVVRSNMTTPLADGRPTPPRRDSIMSQSSKPLPGEVQASSAAAVRPGTATAGPSYTRSGFFEELPASKPRPSSSAGRPNVALAQTMPPPRSSFVPPQAQLPKEPAHDPHPNPYQTQLVPPERLSLYENTTPSSITRQPIPTTNARYSPAPSQNSTAAPPASRYSMASVPRPQSTRALPHQPRTSSPLTQRSASVQQQVPINLQYHDYPNSQSTDPAVSAREGRFDETYNPSGQDVSSGRIGRSMHPQSVTAFTPQGQEDSKGTLSESSTAQASQYDPRPEQSSHAGTQPAHIASTAPPRRSQSQSPNMQVPPLVDRYVPQERPQSVQAARPLPGNDQDLARFSADGRSRVDRGQSIAFVRPSDGRELDNLERWKGCPIFNFGFGGKAVKMFPQRVPRYIKGQNAPLMKSNPGEVRTQDNHFKDLDHSIASFPGPLKGKGKKKDVLDWLKKKIEELEYRAEDQRRQAPVIETLANHDEERILLWKIMGILVEYDGELAGNPVAEKAVRVVLSPESKESDIGGDVSQYDDKTSSYITAKTAALSAAPADSSQVLEHIRKQLLRGEREQAVWHAVDNKMWAHAMLISSTVSDPVRKQVAQEFVRREVQTYNTNTESLSALYQVFAGNWEESVDELVPQSARAGLQMMSMTSEKGPAKNALDGLDKWRDTVALILSNRTAEDGKALVALGKLLASYGRTEASHICYIFAQIPGIFGAPDDPQVSITLLGADHIRRPFDYGRDFDSILLTEVHDFARTVLSSSSVATVSPHLQSYRLYHAMILAEHGYKAEAMKYCEAISATLKSTTKPSPYYHGLLVGSLQGLQDRLRQTPHEASGSWISKPSIDKVSGSIWAKFNSYVAGDEDDAAAGSRNVVHDPAAGPFAGVAGGLTSLSRTTSSANMTSSYGPSFGYDQVTPQAFSPYAPSNGYSTTAPINQQPRPVPAPSLSSNQDALRPYVPHQQSTSRPTTSTGASPQAYALRPSYAPRAQSYQPTVPQANTLADVPNDVDNLSLSGSQSSHIERQASYRVENAQYPPDVFPQSHQLGFDEAQSHPVTPQYGGYTPETNFVSERSHEQTPELQTHADEGLEISSGPQNTYEPPLYSYEPPSYSYEPPSATSYEPSPASPPSENADEPSLKTPKKSMMDLDDDDDFEARAAALRKAEKARKDQEADEAFRKAAEADAQRDNAPSLNSKKSWFGGGWFAGGKEKPKETVVPGGPIKVKLGEENSFYFDKELGKWVNKKGGTTEAAAAPAAPPPKGPSRAVSAAAGPPARNMATPPVPPIPAGIGSGGPPLRAVSGPSLTKPPGSATPLRVSSPVKEGGLPKTEVTEPVKPPSAPPSRPSTSQGGAADMDDLYGPPQARKGGTVRKGKKRAGYVDIMAK